MCNKASMLKFNKQTKKVVCELFESLPVNVLRDTDSLHSVSHVKVIHTILRWVENTRNIFRALDVSGAFGAVGITLFY